MLVWLFAMLASAQTVASALIALHDGGAFAGLVWVATTLFIITVAVSLENVKQFLEGSFG